MGHWDEVGSKRLSSKERSVNSRVRTKQRQFKDSLTAERARISTNLERKKLKPREAETKGSTHTTKDHCTVHIWTFLYGLIIRTNARHEDRRGYHTTKEIMDLRSKSSLLRQIIVIGLIIMLITSTESMPRPGMKKQRHRKSRNAIKSCKNGCYMEYYNCGTMVTSEIDHLVCLTAKSICVANCKATW
eukprot:Seg1221.3 transcript_id=Seg1221.3/GoldUCD/mRNA.D3Y31 product="hypothetical protein" protein_id=Seg1221.3/GoldUCD/D3Y31